MDCRIVHNNLKYLLYIWHTNLFVQSDITKPQHNSKIITIPGDIFSCEEW